MDKCLKELRVARKPLRSVSVSGKTQKFELTCGDTVQRWHIMRQLQFAMFTGHTDAVLSLVYLEAPSADRSDDARVFSASHDNSVCCWDPYDMACLYRLKEKTSEVSCMVYLEHAGLLVTSNDDGSVRFWNPDAGSSMVYRHHTNTVSCLTVAHLKRCTYLISGSFDGYVVSIAAASLRVRQVSRACSIRTAPAELVSGTLRGGAQSSRPLRTCSIPWPRAATGMTARSCVRVSWTPTRRKARLSLWVAMNAQCRCVGVVVCVSAETVARSCADLACWSWFRSSSCGRSPRGRASVGLRAIRSPSRRWPRTPITCSRAPTTCLSASGTSRTCWNRKRGMGHSVSERARTIC